MRFKPCPIFNQEFFGSRLIVGTMFAGYGDQDRAHVCGLGLDPLGGEGDGRDSVGRYYNYPSPEWLAASYAAAASWTSLSSDTSEIKSFDAAPATMLHLTVRKSAA